MSSLGSIRLALSLVAIMILISPPPTSGAGGALSGLLPPSEPDSPWVMTDDPREFDRESLYDYIDGAEAAYREYGFRRVVTAEYESKIIEGLSAVVDIYDMGSSLGAFGIYSVERSPDYRFLRAGIRGYLGGGALNFWKGSYYIKITSFGQGEEVDTFLLSLARAVEGKIGETGEEPIQVALFPSERLVPNSTVYYPNSLLGHSFLGAGFTASYRVEDEEYTAFITEKGDAADARDAFVLLREHYASLGRVEDDSIGDAASSFSGEDPFYGAVTSFRQGNFVGGALGPDGEVAEEIAASLLRNIKR